MLRNGLKLYNDIKVGESDEFDINVVVNLPFDESEVTLNYTNSSPSYTLVEVPKEIVKSHRQDYNMFSEDPGEKHQISAPKLDQHLHCAISSDLNMYNESGRSDRIDFDTIGQKMQLAKNKTHWSADGKMQSKNACV